MKAKFNVTTKIEGQDVNVEAEVAYTLEEAKGMWELSKQVAKESPEVINNFIEEIAGTFLKAKEIVMKTIIKSEEMDRENPNTAGKELANMATKAKTEDIVTKTDETEVEKNGTWK